jgi:(1->4)-alpha-D-glucan 1-alpha-D-glucosylmutase
VTAEPRSTYRIQFTPSFGFDAGAALAPYLRELGVSHLYSSPALQAAPGSTHGYDVVDHHKANDELGGEEAHTRLHHALVAAGLGMVLDVVPNHMAITVPQNAWWWDVLENGPSSVYASHFDITWDPPETKLRNTVLLPVLGDHYGRVLDAGEITVSRQEASFTVHYYDNVFPVAPKSLDTLLLTANQRGNVDELESVAMAFGKLPPAWATDTESVRERHRDKEVLRARLAELCRTRPEVGEAIDAELAVLNRDPDALDALLERQNYRLAYWRTAARDLDYRRFFDITSLIGLRVEDEQVFLDTHERILDWVHDGRVDGLRIDHPDGLRDPAGYLRRLAVATSDLWVVVEKILEPGERLRSDWATAGTTGYDFLNRVGGLFVDPAGEQPLTDLYAQLTGETTDWDALVLEKKRAVLDDALAADLTRLTALFVEVCERHRRYRDYTRHELHQVLREAVAAFSVYRTYVRPGHVTEADITYVTEAMDAAVAHRPDLDPDLFDFLRDLLLQSVPGGVEEELVARFQQLTSPVMAKGVEDTAFYNHNRLVSLNEVGGDPSVFGWSVDEFHAACAETQREWPTTMLATSTHDTKRSEDVRARLALLSQIPDEWGRAVRGWMADHPGPDRNTEYLLYQTLVGAWPLPVERAVAYMEKATKEAKAHTSWTDPNPDFDQAVRAFVESLLADGQFVASLERFVEPLIGPGRITSLAQALVKLTAPGVPDTYQGCELWDLSLVDPDNRRPVDYDVRWRLLRSLHGLAAEHVLAQADSGLPKLLVTREALHLRNRHPEAFGPKATYVPLAAPGNVVAFCRSGVAVTVVPRLVLSKPPGDGTVAVPEGTWHNVLTGESVTGGDVPVAGLLGRFPVALLEVEVQ